MSNRIHALAQQLTGKATIEECSVDELRHIVKRHPYFAPAQFLLLQKLKQLNSEETEAQQKKAVLFYHDPLLFDYFISSDKFYVDETNLREKKEAIALNKFNGITGEEIYKHDNLSKETENEILEGEPTGINDSVETNDADLELVESIDNVSNGSPAEIQDTKNSEESFDEKASTDTLIELVEEDLKDEIIESKPEIPSEQQLPAGTMKEISLENAQIVGNAGPMATDTTKHELAFEPYHTVDYFASQGIKISQEVLSKDKLGKQLKSFTEWLKTMKRLPATQITASVEALAEKKVETMADRSVSESDVVTEAMAEVWLKQGNKEKAMEIYNKLSLLDPSKTAYFAAKIENLKQS